MAKKKYYRLDGTIEDTDQEKSSELLSTINKRMKQQEAPAMVKAAETIGKSNFDTQEPKTTTKTTIKTNKTTTNKTTKKPTETKQEKPKKASEDNISTGIINNDGYEETNKKYRDYDYLDWANKKDYKIYKKDGKAYYYDEKRNQYVDMDTPVMTSSEQSKKDYEQAVSEGYVGQKTYNKKVLCQKWF